MDDQPRKYIAGYTECRTPSPIPGLLVGQKAFTPEIYPPSSELLENKTHMFRVGGVRVSSRLPSPKQLHPILFSFSKCRTLAVNDHNRFLKNIITLYRHEPLL